MQPAVESCEKVKRDRKSPINHVNAVTESYSLFQYPAFEQTKLLVDSMEEFFNAIPFHGNRILKADVEKDTEWYNSVLDLCAAVKQFVQENCSKVN